MLSLLMRNKFYFGLFFWFFASPFYYFWNFYTGSLIIDLDEGVFHRLLKYLVAISICAFFFLKRGYLHLLLIYLFLSIALTCFLFLGVYSYDVRTQVTLLLIFISFSGFMLFPTYMSDKELDLILDAVVISSVLVSLITFYEYFYMWPVLGDYWRATGGYRSVSTMLNPNNLGVYLGVCLLILLLHNKYSVFLRFLAVTIVAAAFVMSGSRTAVVSLVLPMFCGLLFLPDFKIRLNFLFFLICLGVFSIVSLFFVLHVDWLPSGRYFDMKTAIIRLDKYFSYLYLFDFSYIVPDFTSERSYYVSESSYFYFINTFGVIFSFFLILVYLIFFRLNNGFLSFNGPRRVLTFVVLYYIVCFLFENMIASFPNNQLFFFALGVILLPRRIGFRARGCYV